MLDLNLSFKDEKLKCFLFSDKTSHLVINEFDLNFDISSALENKTLQKISTKNIKKIKVASFEAAVAFFTNYSIPKCHE